MNIVLIIAAVVFVIIFFLNLFNKDNSVNDSLFSGGLCSFIAIIIVLFAMGILNFLLGCAFAPMP